MFQNPVQTAQNELTPPLDAISSTYINPYINISCSSMIGRSSGQKKRSASSMTINWHWLLGWMKNLSTSSLVICFVEANSSRRNSERCVKKRNVEFRNLRFIRKYFAKSVPWKNVVWSVPTFLKGQMGQTGYIYIYKIYIYKYIIMYLTTSICLISLWQLWKKAQQVFSSWIMKSNFSNTLIPTTHALSCRDHNRAV